ncbi:putative indolepyruvate decarboxylase family protein [Lachancea thermotolerans CBS 6340]|uniref:2-hydroxyacyl-CoA lyase n=1 Tax=Lachancea thermotolerans (strain ATCC 56472 / CBS 6340 / NRRL Y-8284) TaxID=559295 RepID=C5E3J6_LACTC|nr:KLTH0H14102p [Lachancea thermotolerans CBS 6340]CAR30607.1 KLTH0H14102p [Lachancea thermotolerans CBS 6340]
MSAFPEYLSELLHGYGITAVFGIVGIPIVELADAMISHGKVKFYGFRNEQAASYAASAYGYLTGRPGVLLVVGGPGVIHALAGVYNSISNKWPLIVLAGSSEDSNRGGFQELDQIALLSKYVKYSSRLSNSNVDQSFYDALRQAVLGTPGVSYLDIPANVIDQEVEKNESFSRRHIAKISYQPTDAALQRVAKLLNANRDKNILCVIGKGATENAQQIRPFVDEFQLPFLSTPMAKGVVPDSHALNVSSARSLALKSADIVLVLGARLNWILHFGEAPKWKNDAIFIQIDTTAEELGHNNGAGTLFSLCGDIGTTVAKLTPLLAGFSGRGLFGSLETRIQQNEKRLRARENEPSPALTYNKVYATIRKQIVDKDTIIVSEGANTMDVARISFPTDYPKLRMDAGTNATMGVGLGYAIAAKIAHPQKNVIAIQGDSAFGFSGMELETASRYKLGITVVVMNNSGIYHGEDPAAESSPNTAPSTALSQECRYDLVAEGLGCRGFVARTQGEVSAAFAAAIKVAADGRPALINVMIEPGPQGKLSFGWQKKAKL